MSTADIAPYLRSMTPRWPAPLDWVVASAVIGVGVVDIVENIHGPQWLAVVAIVVFALCLLVRRTSLWLAVVVAFGTIVVTYSFGLSQFNFLASVIACLVLVWWVGYQLRFLESLLGVCYAYACVVAVNGTDFASVIWLLLVIGGAWLAGRTLRSRRLLIEDLRRTTSELELSREQLAERVVADERLRIAQEIHDVVAHSVTVMLVQAEAAERVMPAMEQNGDAAESVRAVQESGRQALAELRQLLGVLRPEGSVATSPQPRLSDLSALAESYETAGLRVACSSVIADDLPSNVELTAYRVAQEALTNVLRHSEASFAHLDVRRLGDALHVEVTDNGPARPSTVPSGHGLAGMRERVAACGGHLDAGPHGNGYRVAADLPLVVPA